MTEKISSKRWLYVYILQVVLFWMLKRYLSLFLSLQAILTSGLQYTEFRIHSFRIQFRIQKLRIHSLSLYRLSTINSKNGNPVLMTCFSVLKLLFTSWIENSLSGHSHTCFQLDGFNLEIGKNRSTKKKQIRKLCK